MTLFPPDEPTVLRAAPPAPVVHPTFSVTELVDRVNGVLHRDLGAGVWVRGEIQGWNERGPHAYFRLVEDGPSGKAVVNVQLFAPARARLRPLLERHRLRLSDGIQVRVFGRLELYAPSGQLGLKVSDLDPTFTLGDLAARRDDLLRRLVADGRFDANRGRPLSAAPLRLGVVTSTASAAWADFVHEIERSGFAFQVQVADVRVQGPAAPQMISRAISWFSSRKGLDAVVVIRGGGSRTELVTFDDEGVATAIANCPIPVFTGIGHEIDRSIADEVAHTAVKTPTACATALVERTAAFLLAIDASWMSVASRAALAVDRSAVRWDRQVARLRTQSERVTARADGRLDAAVHALTKVPQRLDAEGRHLDGLAAQVRLADPVNALRRGWSITRTVDGRVVRDPTTLAVDDVLITTFATGSARSRVVAAEADTAPAPSEDPTS